MQAQKPHQFVKKDPDQWNLYDIPGAKKAAERMNDSVNAEIEKAFMSMAKGTPPCDALLTFQMNAEKVFSKESEFGATDSMESVISNTIQQVFGEDLMEIGKPKKKRLTP